MDLKDIQELIKFVAKSGATEVDLEIDNIKISNNIENIVNIQCSLNPPD